MKYQIEAGESEKSYPDSGRLRKLILPGSSRRFTFTSVRAILGLTDSAQYVYEECIKIFPDYEEPRRALAYLYSARENYRRAIEEYETIRKLGKATKDDRLTVQYFRTNQYEKAAEVLEEVLKMKPNDEAAQNALQFLRANHTKSDTSRNGKR